MYQNMDSGRIIDLRQYFAVQCEQNAEEVKTPGRAGRFWDAVDRVVTSAAAVVMAGCLGICTLLLFTML